MRRLHLLRHAKSSWDDGALPDHDRPLAPRGRRDAGAMAAHLADTAVTPDLVLCSSALRTRQTLALILPALGEELTVQVERNLYGANAGALLERIRKVPDRLRYVMVIGHNPGIEEVAALLVRSGEGPSEGFPTCALATLEFRAAGWGSIEPGTGRLLAFVSPTDLG